MNAPNRFLRTDSAGSPLVPLAPSRSMDFFQLQDRFWQLQAEEAISPAETTLYFYWLYRFNKEYWPAGLPRTVKQVSADLKMDEKTVDKARKSLESRGLLTYQAGDRSRSAVWGLSPTHDRKNSGHARQTSPTDNRNFSGQQGGNPGNSPTDDRKNSAPYKEENKNSSVVENTTQTQGVGAGSAEKKLAAAAPEKNYHAEDPDASASHTGAAAPAEGEARALAGEMATYWHVTELRNYRSWAKFYQFCRLLAAAGQLERVRTQFEAYRAYRAAKGIGAHSIDAFLGHETSLSPDNIPYQDGAWTATEWPDMLASLPQSTSHGKAQSSFGSGSAAASGHVADLPRNAYLGRRPDGNAATSAAG